MGKVSSKLWSPRLFGWLKGSSWNGIWKHAGSWYQNCTEDCRGSTHLKTHRIKNLVRRIRLFDEEVMFAYWIGLHRSRFGLRRHRRLIGFAAAPSGESGDCRPSSLKPRLLTCTGIKQRHWLTSRGNLPLRSRPGADRHSSLDRPVLFTIELQMATNLSRHNSDWSTSASWPISASNCCTNRGSFPESNRCAYGFRRGFSSAFHC